MDENLHHIDDLFKKGINDYEEAPSKNVWEQLDKDLDKRKVVSISRKYNALKWVAAALFLFSSAIAMYTFNMRSKISESEAGRSDHPFNGQQNPGSGDQVVTQRNDAPSKNNATSSAGTLSPKDFAQGNNAAEVVVDQQGGNVNADSRNAKQLNNPDNNAANRSTPGIQPETISGKVMPEAILKPENAGNLASLKSYIGSKKSADKKLDLAGNIVRDRNSSAILPDRPQANDQPSLAIAADPEAKTLNINPDSETDKASITPTMLAKYRTATFSRSSLPALTAEQEKMAIRLQTTQKPMFTITPFYSFDALHSRVSNTDFKFREEDRREIKDKEEIGNSSTIGLAFHIALDDRWSLGSGLAKSSMTTTIKPKQIFARPDNTGKINYRINCAAGYTVVNLKYSPTPGFGDSVLALASKNTLEYFSVPLNLSYKIGKGKFTVSPGVGLAMNFLSKSSIQTEISKGALKEKMSFDRIEGLNSTYVSGNIGVGIDYAMNRTFSLSLLPSTAIGMSSINSNTPVRTFLNKTSLGLGLSINL